MTTRETIQGYFDQLATKAGWESFLADDMVFVSHVSPIKRVEGKGAYLEATKRFFSSIVTFELQDLIVEGDKACASTRYQLKAPSGATFQSDVAEVYSVKDDKITSFDIYFDSAPFPK